MTCERFREIDTESFLIDASAAEFDSFRMHLFDCEPCAGAVESWTAFEATLRDAMDTERLGVEAHPEPERLEQFAASAAQMGDEAMSIENHLSVCASCRSEIAVIKRFEPDFLAALPSLGGTARLDPSAGRVASPKGLIERVRSWLPSPAVSIPAFALAALIVFGLWSTGMFDGQKSSRLPDPAPQIVQQPTTPSSASPVDPNESLTPNLRSSPNAPVPPTTPQPTESLALGADPEMNEPANREASLPDGTKERLDDAVADLDSPSNSEPRVQLAEASTEAVPEGAEPGTDVMPTGDPIERLAQAPGEILLAALTELPLPDYTAPAGAGSVGWLRQLGAVRAGTATARVETLAPQSHAGLALDTAPRLWWSLSEDTSYGIEVMVVDDREIDPVAQVQIAGPVRAGLHSIDLADQGVSLDRDVEYRWFVSLIVDADRPSRNPVAGGALRILGDDDPRRVEVREASPTERGHTLARLGVWYDAYDFFASISESHPELTSLARQREHLSKTAGAGG